MWMWVFMILPLLGIAYIAWHLWTLLPLASVWKVALILLLVGSFVMMFLNFGRRFDTLPLSVAQVCYEVSTSSIFVMLYLVILFLVLDLGRLVRLVPRSWLYQNGWTAAAILVLMVGVFLYGNIHYNNKVRVELSLPTEKLLPKDYRVVMLSDLHIGYHNPRKELARWVDLVNAEKPDFILIAGDIIDGSMRPVREERMAEEFRRLEAPVYACLGNHEYFSGSPEARQFYADAGIHLLVIVFLPSCVPSVASDQRSSAPFTTHPSPLSSTTSPTTLTVPSVLASTSNSAGIPIVDRYGPSRGLPTMSMSVRGAVTSVARRASTSPVASVSGAESSASVLSRSMSWLR